VLLPTGGQDPPRRATALDRPSPTPAPQCALVVDCSQPGLPIVCVTKGAEALTGFSSDELCGEKLEILNGEKTEPAALEEIAAAFEDGQATVLDLNHYKRNKQLFRNMIALVPMTDTNGALVRMVVLMQDISDRRRGEAPTAMLRELAERHMRCLMLVDASSPDAPIQSVSDGFQEQTGFGPSAVTGLSCLCLGGPESDKVDMSKLVIGMRDLSAVSIRLLLYRQSGDPFWAQMVAFPHLNAGGHKKSGVVSLGSHQKQVLLMVADVTQTKPKKIGKYQLGKVIGQGASGVVRKGRDVTTNELVAVKMVNGSNFRNIQEIEQVQDEMRVLSSLKHDHIIRLLDVQYIGNCIYFVMEFAGGGELHKYMWEKEHHRLSEEDAKVMFRQCLAALDYCHKRRIVHRDLKPENLLMDENNNIKVADFGLAGITSGAGKTLNQMVGTPEFAAPEIVNGLPYEGSAVDIWSMGVILYEMTCGSLPFKGPSMRELFKKISAGQMAPMLPHLSADLKDLVKRMLTVDASKRLTLAQVKKHKWVYLPGDDDEGMEATTKRTLSSRALRAAPPKEEPDDAGLERVYTDQTHSSLNLVIPTSSLTLEAGGRDGDDDDMMPGVTGRASSEGPKRGSLVAGRGHNGESAGARKAAGAKAPSKRTLLSKFGGSGPAPASGGEHQVSRSGSGTGLARAGSGPATGTARGTPPLRMPSGGVATLKSRQTTKGKVPPIS